MALVLSLIPSLLFFSGVTKKTDHSNVTTISLFIIAVGAALIMFVTDRTAFILLHI